jgi:Ran GTPase-activating protein (RanGAP) involved in mRNA processing and transport
MAKNQGKECTPGEIKFVQTVLLKGEPPLWIKWVTKRKREKIQDRLVVVGKYRIFSIKRTITGKKTIQRVGHYYDMIQIQSDDVDRCILQFKDFFIDIQEQTAGTELITIIRKQFQRISYSFADYAIPKITLVPPERTLVELPPIDPGPANGFIATYEAFCDYYSQEPSQELIKYINDQVVSGSHDLIMDRCPGFERKVDAIDFIPIRAALRHNTYFTSFIARHIPRREVMICLADTILHNVTIQKLQLDGIDATDQGAIALGISMKKNLHNSLIDIDLSNNPGIKEKGFLSISEGLLALQHSLTRLNLACCQMSVKSTSAIISALSLGKFAGSNMCEFDFSYNTLGAIGSAQLSTFFSVSERAESLRFILLANTRLEVALLMTALRTGKAFNVEELDISGNKMDLPSSTSTCKWIENLSKLSILNISNCSMSYQTAVPIIQAVASNQNLKNVTIHVSRNELGPQGGLLVSQIISSSISISALIMRSCGLKKEGLMKISEELGKNTSLKMLDLSLNFHSGNSAKMLKLMQTLADSASKHPSLEHLDIFGDGNKLCVGKELQPIVQIISSNCSVTELDISGNRIGDQLAVSLADALRTNTKLKSLSWDRNGISTGGWQALANALNFNKTLCHCPTPRSDIDRALRESKNREALMPRLKEIIDKLRESLKRNGGGQTYSSVYLQTKQGRDYRIPVSTHPNSSPSDQRPASSVMDSHQFGSFYNYDNSARQTYNDYDYSSSNTSAEPSSPRPFLSHATSFQEVQPPPPPLQVPIVYQSLDAIPPAESTTSHSQDYDDTSASFDGPPPYQQDYTQEYDDSIYEQTPAPPPPPPF